MDEVIDIEVVEEARYVKKNDGGAASSAYGAFSLMDKAHGCIDCAVVISRSELIVGEEGVEVGVGEESLGNYLLQKLAAALQEADRAVCFGEAVIWALWLGQDHYFRVMPRVVT